MKKIFLFIMLSVAVFANAVTVSEVAGKFSGSLTIGEEEQSSEVIILPGVNENSITLVLADFSFLEINIGDIVVPNVPMSDNGNINITDFHVFIKALNVGANVSIKSGSKLSAAKALLNLTIVAEGVDGEIPVYFMGSRVSANTQMPNSDFEAAWSNGEPQSWHGFPTVTGTLGSVVKNTDQLKESSDVRPGSTGKKSVLLLSRYMNYLFAKVKANGPLTNGQMNGGSASAADATGNYAFSDPSNSGFNTPFTAQPDSFVFWAKYVPADKKASNSDNKARMHIVLTTNSRYQDPESGDFSKARVAEATLNFSATSSLGWQRISLPFVYGNNADLSKIAYIMLTASTNAVANGGTTSADAVDNLFLDDFELVYNASLKQFNLGNQTIQFVNGKATTDMSYSDKDYEFNAVVDGRTAKAFVGFDGVNQKVIVYVISDNFAANASDYKVYEVQMKEVVTGFQNAKAETAKVKKIMVNGQVYIQKGNEMFNLLGQPVKL